MNASVDRGRFHLSLSVLVYLAAFISTLGLARHVLTDQDPFWHVVAGNWIIEHRAVPHHDVFSHSMPGAPWVAHEWLAEVAIAAVYDHLGWAGLVVMTGLVFAAALALLSRFLLRFLEPVWVVALVLGAWGLCLSHLHARPHVFGLPLLVIWFAILDAGRLDERRPSLVLAPVMLLWANLHGGYMVGLGLAALLAGEAVFDAPSWRRSFAVMAGWGGFLAAAVLAALMTPNGVQGLALPLSFMQQSNFAKSMISEWKGVDFQIPQPIEMWMFLGLLGILSFGLRLPTTRIAILLILLHMTLAHRRFAEILGLVAPLLLAPAMAAQLRARGSGGPAFLGTLAKPATPGGIALVALIVIASSAAFVRFGIDNENHRAAPTAAVAFVKQQHLAGPVFNDYEFGGYLIFSGIAPFVDGRADLYGDDFLRRQADVAALPQILDQYRIAWTLLDAYDPRAVLLDHLPGWRKIFADDIAVVHRRDAAVP